MKLAKNKTLQGVRGGVKFVLYKCKHKTLRGGEGRRTFLFVMRKQ